MSLKDLTFRSTPVVAVTGVADQTIAEDGVAIAGGKHLVYVGDTDFRTRRSLTFKNKNSVYVPKTGRFTKDRKTVSLTSPFMRADGTIAFNTLRIEREIDPETPADNIGNIMLTGVQIITDENTQDYWSYGSTN